MSHLIPPNPEEAGSGLANCPIQTRCRHFSDAKTFQPNCSTV